MLQQLKDTCAEAIEKTGPLVKAIDWSSKDVYASWMAQTYFYVSHSTKIISLAGALMRGQHEHLHMKFVSLCKEELGHDKVIYTDIKQLGYKPEDFQPFAETSAMYQSQYYWINACSPVSVYGYFIFLEGLSIAHGPGLLAELAKHHPKMTTKYLKIHVDDDPEHVDLHNKELHKLSEQELTWAIMNLKNTAHFYQGMLKQLAQAQAGKIIKAA